MPVGINAAAVQRSIAARYRDTANIHAAEAGMTNMIDSASSVRTQPQMLRFSRMGAQLEAMANQNKVALAIDNVLQQEREKRLAKDIQLTFGPLGGGQA